MKGKTAMTMIVWKQELALVDTQDVVVPMHAEFLCACEQHNTICIWFRFEEGYEKHPTTRTIKIVGTGNPGPSAEGRYLGTASLNEGRFMFHVFEQGN